MSRALELAGGYPRCHGCGGVPANTPYPVWDPVLLSFDTLPETPGPPYLFWEWVQNPGTTISRSRREPVCSRCWMSGPLHRYRRAETA